MYIFQSGKNVIANSYALRLAGITKDTADPAEPEGHIVRDDRGEPTGHLIAGAADMARKQWWAHLGQPVKKWDFLYFDQETQIRAIEAQTKIYHQCGIVGVRDMGVSPDEMEAYIQAAHQGRAQDSHRRDSRPPGALHEHPRGHGCAQALLWPAATVGFGVPHPWRPEDGRRQRRLVGIFAREGQGHDRGRQQPRLAAEYPHQHRRRRRRHRVGAERTRASGRPAPIAGRRFSLEHGFGLFKPDHYQRAKRLGCIIGSNALLAYYASARSFHMHKVMEQVRIAKMTEVDPWNARSATGVAAPLVARGRHHGHGRLGQSCRGV